MYPGQSYPPNQQQPPSFTIPAPQTTPAPVPPPTGKGGPLKVVVAIVGAVLLLGGGIALGMALQPKRPAASNQTATPNQGQATDPAKDVETAETTIKVPKPDQQAGDAVPTQTLQLTSPKSWRTVDTRDDAKLELYGNDFDAADLEARLVSIPANAERSTQYSPLAPVNQLTVFTVEHWLGRASDIGSRHVTPDDKKAYFDFVSGVASADDVDGDKCKAAGSILVQPCAQKRIATRTLKSNDGKLSGFAYLTLAASQSPSYHPQVHAVMAGLVNGSRVEAEAIYPIYDQDYENLTGDKSANALQAQVEATQKEFLAGKVKADTKALYDQVVGVVSSLTIVEK